MRLIILLFLLSTFPQIVFSQYTINGSVKSSTAYIADVKIGIIELKKSTFSDESGAFLFSNIPTGNYTFRFQMAGFQTLDTVLIIEDETTLAITLVSLTQELEEVVVSGSLKEVSKLESTIPVELITPAFFKKNPTPNIYEALQNINGIRPQLNCNICNTGDIHINGLEGPYTMILIDGMPIVSSLSTVYGLSGIPNSLIERVEIIRGPASTLYGSEAIGGVINIITKKASSAPAFFADIMTNSWFENNIDLGLKFSLGKKVDVLTGVNYFNYSNPIDNNKDGFTDVTLQDRISIFQKWNIQRKSNKLFSLAGRYFYEDRWGGQMNWNPNFRGGDSIYGESIYTSRWEMLGVYELPVKPKFLLSFSANGHDQNSYYGTTPFMAQQNVFFGQLVHYQTLGRHDFVLGTSARYNQYDDNTPATLDETGTINMPDNYIIPGVFAQDEWSISEKQKMLLGIRWDYNKHHGNIFTPRIGYKYNFKKHQLFRINAGTGYRVVNVFTEDHAALTGARKTEIVENLNPETSYNVNANYYHQFLNKINQRFLIDASVFYTYFNNKIIPDYETDPNKIIYANIDGYAESKGISLNLESQFFNHLRVTMGGTLMDVSTTENGETSRQLLSENFTGTWTVAYSIPKIKMEIDYTGNIYSPMLLPVLNELDPRSNKSPWYSIQNIQVRYSGIKNFEMYGGVKNLLNWTPGKNQPFLIARANDPFDANVNFDSNGNAIATSDNPHALTFDPAYVYGPNQGVRLFMGIRYTLKSVK